MRSHVYIPAVSAAGLLVIGHCISTLVQQPVDAQWFALALLTLLTGALTIKVPSVAARLSVSETFVFAAVLLFGTCAGTITVALEILIAVAVVGTKKRTDPQRLIFNLSSAALSIWLASNAFYATAGIPPLALQQAEMNTLLIPLAVLSSTYFLLNSGLVAIAIALQRGESPLQIWRTNFLGLAINYFAGASLAALFVSVTRTIDLFALSVIVPLLLVSYLTFKTSLGRIEDATRHVDEIKRLYLSSIETLATAIDAKDQVTHGHIRRVQQVALALAKGVGVKDESQLQALEAAALLHDTGKLVIPEHILNKPGKLTRGEFDKMKEHASVGADILSSIDFPFPVVPIVRHHHENWDGTGYPDGLKGTTIPIGARILAVVDCFDALTSDRPYRPRMTPEQALTILIQRRGVMYDPLVVDTFAASWQQFAETGEEVSQNIPVPAAGWRKTEAPLVVSESAAPSRLASSEPLHVLLAAALQKMGARVGIVFAADRERDTLASIAVCASDGPNRDAVSMPLGNGISGWVAVNGSAVMNADPTLDLGASAMGSSLVRTICVPLWVNGDLSGVVSVYSSDPRGFSDDDRSFLEDLVSGLDPKTFSVALADSLRSAESRPETVHTIH